MYGQCTFKGSFMPNIQEAKCFEFIVQILPPPGAHNGGATFFAFISIDAFLARYLNMGKSGIRKTTFVFFYSERNHQMSYSSLSDNGMLQIFSFLIK